MISFGRRGRALLLGIATGSLLIGGVAIATPATVVPVSWQALLGADAPAAQPQPETRPSWRTVAPVAAAPVTAAPLAAAPVAAALPTAATTPAEPAPTTTQPPAPEPPAEPTAVPVRALVPAEADRGEKAQKATADDAATSDAATVDDSASGFVAEVIALTNEQRREAGCADLKRDAPLTRSAQQHATDMAQNDYFAHESQDGTRFDQRIRAEGHSRPGGENIAKGQTSAEQVVREWMASPPHRRNIENCAFVTIGVGYDDDYWVQDFGR